MLRQTQPFRDAAANAALYAERYDHARWEEHATRIAWAKQRLNDWLAWQTRTRPLVVADLSAGDGALVQHLQETTRSRGCTALTSDLTPGAALLRGEINDVIRLLNDQVVDLFICTETLEHLQRPFELLREIRRVAREAFISTPAWPADNPDWVDDNPEHYWQWDAAELGGLLLDVGFQARELTLVRGDYYTYQCWVVS